MRSAWSAPQPAKHERAPGPVLRLQHAGRTSWQQRRSAFFEDKPGKCPQSGAPLVPVRLLTAVFMSQVPVVPPGKAGHLPGGQERTRADHRWRSTSRARTIRMSTSSHPEPAPTAAPGSEPMNAAPTATTTRATAASFSWPKTIGTISRARSCGRIVFRVYFYDDFTPPAGRRAAFPRRSRGPMPSGKNSPRRLRSGRPARDRNTLEAPMPGAALPPNFELRVKFKPQRQRACLRFHVCRLLEGACRCTSHCPAAPVIAAVPQSNPQPAAAAQPPQRRQTSVARADPAASSAAGDAVHVTEHSPSHAKKRCPRPRRSCSPSWPSARNQ